MTVSAPIKIFALLALLAGVVFAGAMMFLGPGEDTELAAAPIVLPKKQTGILAAPAGAKAVANKANAAVKAAAKPAAGAPAKPAAKAPAKPAVATNTAATATAPKKARPVRVVAANGLPMQLAVALRRHDVVVLALWGTGGKIDAMARDEAAAGAAAAGAGFVPLNVIERSKEAEALTLKFGLIRTPAVLYFTAPDVLASRLDGFRDRETVAQAALNALR